LRNHRLPNPFGIRHQHLTRQRHQIPLFHRQRHHHLRSFRQTRKHHLPARQRSSHHQSLIRGHLHRQPRNEHHIAQRHHPVIVHPQRILPRPHRRHRPPTENPIGFHIGETQRRQHRLQLRHISPLHPPTHLPKSRHRPR